MKRWLILFSLLGIAGLSGAIQKPTQGKVRIRVTARENSVSNGVRQRESELEESVRDLRARLNKRKWIEVTDSEDDADIDLELLGRHEVPEKGYVLHYTIDAGAYGREDEFAYAGEAVPTGGIRARSYDGHDNSKEGRAILRWEELAKHFADSLEEFAESNYERIIAQR